MSRSVDSDNSEFLIDNLVIGLYPLSASDKEPATMWLTYSNLNAHNSKSITVQLSNDMLNNLFGGTSNGAKCRIFALANVPEDIQVTDHASISQLKELQIEANFQTLKKQESFVMAGGNNEVTYNAPANLSQKGHAIGSVTLVRAAAKINLNIKLPTKIDIKDEEGNNETWRPVTTQGIRVLLNNGVQKAFSVTPDPDENGNQWKPTDDEDYYNSLLVENSERILTKSGSGNYPFVMDVPFYTYPNSWTENFDEKHKTTLTLLVPWEKDGDDNTWYTFYYMVPITPSDVTFIASNHSYTINLEVGMLGALVPDIPVEVENVSYQIVNWGEMEVKVPIEENRYLVVNPNVYSFNNEVNMAVPYYTSHPVKITDVAIKYQRFNFVSDPKNAYVGKVVEFTIDEEKIKATNEKYEQTAICETSFSETANQEYVNVYHPLNLWEPYFNDTQAVKLIGHNKEYANDAAFEAEVRATEDSISYYKPLNDDAFSMYTITLTLSHIDNPQFSESITIYQYPAIYIEAFRNPASTVKGNVFVNGYTNTNAVNIDESPGPSYGSVLGNEDESSSNKNPNMYIINITSLSSDNKFTIIDDLDGEKKSTYNYIIGDPRMKEIKNLLNTNYIDENNTSLGWRNLNTTPSLNKDGSVAILGQSWCREVAALYMEEGVSERRLSYYYNTIEDGSVANMVAPQFRIASSWGTTTSITRPYARYRAALYQENAYPAGRWRVPTLAEFCFINKLSAEDKIPLLFAKGTPYWTSEGLYSGHADGTIHRYKGTGKYGTDQGRKSAVRAVYDEWYWKDSRYVITPDGDGNYTYTLGDVPRGVK